MAMRCCNCLTSLFLYPSIGAGQIWISKDRKLRCKLLVSRIGASIRHLLVAIPKGQEKVHRIQFWLGFYIPLYLTTIIVNGMKLFCFHLVISNALARLCFHFIATQQYKISCTIMNTFQGKDNSTHSSKLIKAVTQIQYACHCNPVTTLNWVYVIY